MSAPDDLSAAIAAQLGQATGLPAFGYSGPFPYSAPTKRFPTGGPEQGIFVTRTLDRRTETEWSSTFGNEPGKPNLYTVVLVTGRFRAGTDLTAAEDTRAAALVAIRTYLWSPGGRRLFDGTQNLCQKAGEPLEVKNDPQGNVISYMREAFVGAFITLGVEEQYVTV